MRLFIIPALAALLALGGCQTFDTKIRENLDVVCATADLADETFLAITKSVTVDQRAIDSVAVLYSSVQTVCNNPDTVSTIKIVTQVATVGVKIYSIITQVTQNNPAAAEAIQ